MTDFYEDLGVPKDADAAQIKRAHRKAAKQHHPDAGGDRDDFEKVQTAYVVLSDPDKRARYDRGESVDDGPDNFEAGVATILCSSFVEAMQECDIVHDDVIDFTRDLIGAKAKAVRKQIDHSIVVIDKLETILQRLTAKGPRNFIGTAIEDQLRDARRAKAHLEEKQKAHIAAAALCDEFAYQTDERAPPPMSSGIWSDNVRPAGVLSIEDLMRAMQKRAPGGDYYFSVDPGA